MTIAELIRARLAVRLSPSLLEITDESELHRGHTGWHEGGETHFRVRIASPRFEGLNRVARHRLIHRSLGDVMTRIHALALEVEDEVENEGGDESGGEGGNGQA